MTKHTLSVLVEDQPGVLTRIAGLFSRRGFNIESLAVGPTEHEGISRMTIVVNVEQSPLEQVTKQLNKLVEVIKIVELDPTASVHRRWAASASARSPDGVNARSSCQVSRSWSVESQTPVPRPARNAAPRAVVSVSRGRSTVTPSWSAWIWHSRSLAQAPPSTLRVSRAGMVSMTSRTSKAIASSVARTRCARPAGPWRCWGPRTWS